MALLHTTSNTAQESVLLICHHTFSGDSSIKLVSSGDNFVEVETVVYNQAVSTLAANQLKARTRTKYSKPEK